MRTGPAGTPPARLLELLEKDELDWDNEQHRIAYLKAWAAGQLDEVISPASPATGDGTI